MDGCSTPGWGLDPSSSECHDRGVCVNSTAYSSHFSRLCVCNEALYNYNGANDYFDTRVARDAAGNILSIGCSNSITGALAGWSILLFCVVLREMVFVAALIQQIRRHGIKNKNKTLRNFMPYRVLFAETFLSTPCHIVSASLKVAGARDGSNVLGTDPAVTFFLVMGLSSSLFFYGDFLFEQFRSISVSRKLNSAETGRLLILYRRITQSTFSFYLIFTAIPSFVMLGTDKSLGPVNSGETTLLVIKNVGIVLWQISQMVGNLWLKRETKLLLRNIAEVRGSGEAHPSEKRQSKLHRQESDSNHTPTSSSTGNGNLESLMAGPVAVLKFLDETQDAVRKSLIMAFVTFTLMSLPWFWPYQQYGSIIVQSFAAFTSCEGFVFLRMRGGRGGGATNPVSPVASRPKGVNNGNDDAALGTPNERKAATVVGSNAVRPFAGEREKETVVSSSAGG